MTLAIIGIVASLVLFGMGGLRNIAQRRSLAADLYSATGLARARAVARQRTQIIVIAAKPASSSYYGFYLFEDNTQPRPSIFTAANLSAIVNAAFDPSAPPANLRRVDDSLLRSNQFLLSKDAWRGKPLPFPWAGLAPAPGGAVDTTGGCTFCTGGMGAAAFLPNGKAIFSDGNTTGGLVVLTSAGGNATVTPVLGVAISQSGFTQLLEPP